MSNVPAGATTSAALNKPQAGDPVWLVEALKLDGLKEVPGAKHAPEVVKLFADSGNAGVKDDETAWCAAFVGAALRRAGYLSTGKLNARSYLDFGEIVTNPKRGDVVVFPRGNSAWQGHVAFVAKTDDKYVHAFGGNQANAVNITRYSRAKVLGFRRPVAQKIVQDIQTKLHVLGFNGADNLDGIMGPATKKAIASYEISKGFAPFGSIPALYKHLYMPAKPSQAPAAAPPKPVTPPAPEKPAHKPYSWHRSIAGYVAAVLVFSGFLWTFASEQLAAFWGWLGSLFGG